MTLVAAERTGASRYDAQVAAALRAVEVRPPAAFLWFGRRFAVLPPERSVDARHQLVDVRERSVAHDLPIAACDLPAAARQPAFDARELLVDAIAQHLQEGFQGTGVPRPQRRGAVTPADDGGDFVRALAQANCGRGAWQGGWRVAAVEHEDGTIAVVRPDGLRLLAPAEDCRVEGAIRAGAQADVRGPKELTGFSPGVYVALGDTPGPAGDLARLYWSIAAAGAVTFVARATYALNRANLPFRLELPDNPARYGRRPAATVLLARADVAAAVTLLRPLLRVLAAHLADRAPAFSKPLARGLALAEEPGDGTGFGEHRCRLLAGAIVTASEQGRHRAEQRHAVVRERFRAAGLTLDAPYVEPGSDDAYPRS
jgi:hypothetical protein